MQPIVSANKLISPLFYPGSGVVTPRLPTINRAVELFPKPPATVVSCFLGGGKLEIKLASEGYDVIGYDLFKPLMKMWYDVLNHTDLLVNKTLSVYQQGLGQGGYFEELLDKRYEGEPMYQSALILCMNHLLNKRNEYAFSFRPDAEMKFPDYYVSGKAMYTYSNSGLSHFAYDYDLLSHIAKASITTDCLSCFDAIDLHHNDFLYLDPPTWQGNKRCYGDSDDYLLTFDHTLLRDKLTEHDQWVLTTKDVGPIKQLYDYDLFIVESIPSIYKNRREYLVIYPAVLLEA